MAETASEASRLLEFVRTARANGADDATIALMLREAGWSERKIQSSLAADAAARYAVAPPARGGRSEGAREAFFYLLSFALLATWSIALVWMVDILVDTANPDPLQAVYQVTFSRSDIAGQLASVLIAFPLYLWVNVLLNREIAARPETLDSGVRKWLTYVALVVAAGALVGDATTFLARFLGGGLTVSFVYKATFLLVVSAAIFSYYLSTIRAQSATTSLNRLFCGVATAGVALCVAWAFFGIGSPAYERRLDADAARVESLKRIARAIYEGTPSHAPPRTAAHIGVAARDLRDPITRAAYAYRRIDARAYQLCATFDAATPPDDIDSAWKHPAGNWCYRIAAATGTPPG